MTIDKAKETKAYRLGLVGRCHQEKVIDLSTPTNGNISLIETKKLSIQKILNMEVTLNRV